VRTAIGSVGIWWLLFSIPLVLFLRERIVPRPGDPGVSAVKEAVRKLAHTVRNIRRIPTLARYTIAFLLFNDGVQTVIAMSSTFGSEALGMSNEELIQCFLLIQGVAIVGSLSMALLASKFQDKPALVVTLVIWVAIVSWAFFIGSSREFWYLGVAVGLVMGGTQAIARAIQSKFTPPTSAAEFFGFYAITGKFASAIGPAMFAGVTSMTGNVRFGVLSIAVLFVAGLIVLLPVNEKKGVAEAEAEERRLKGAAP
jgi:UMF1 family MFS transporter